MIRTVLTVVAMAIGVSAVVAQTDPIATRKGLMKKNNENARNVEVRWFAEKLLSTPPRSMQPSPNGARPPNASEPVPRQFEDRPGHRARCRRSGKTRSDFDAKIAAFAKAVADNKDKAASLDALKASFPNVNKACDDCHESYRRPAQRQPAAAPK